MPKIGKVAGIDNIHDIYDSQRLFNKLKGRLSQLQDSVDVLNTQIDRVEVLKRTQAQAEQNVGEAVVTGYSPALYPPAPIGEEIGGGVGGGGTDPSVTSVSVSVSARKYNEEDNIGSTASCTWIDEGHGQSYSAYYEGDDGEVWDWIGEGGKYYYYYEYQASFTMINQGDNGDETITLDLHVSGELVEEYEWGDWDLWGGSPQTEFESYRFQPFRGTEMYEEDDDTWNSTPDWWVDNHFGRDNTTSILYEMLNRVEEYSTIPLTEAETEAIALAKSYRWKNESNNPVTHMHDSDNSTTPQDDEDVYLDEGSYEAEDSGNDTFSGVSGFHTHIQLRYSVSLGTDVDSIESDAIIPTDNGDNWTSEQIRWYDSGTFTNDYYIDVGVWDTKGNPSSNSIDVILYA